MTNPATRSEQQGYQDGLWFVQEEADYDELAAIAREGTIPPGWDIFRAEICNRYLGRSWFDFSAYARGFGQACRKIFALL